ncbi:phage holin family protein [Bacillus sp. REN10]|uniref:phage holin family protein n=1 Tax=Bacillus sp. REN10 TaxID=2782541 RepID=UPI00193B7B5B|nr:phage holin family protein [Bacillus sp. REN10]
MRWFVGILINALLFIALSGYFTSVEVDSVGSAIMASIVLSILNVLVRPLLIILTLPITFVTLGFFLFVINALTLMLTDSIMGSHFEIDGFGMALFIAVLMSLVNLILQLTIFQKE